MNITKSLKETFYPDWLKERTLNTELADSMIGLLEELVEIKQSNTSLREELVEMRRVDKQLNDLCEEQKRQCALLNERVRELVTLFIDVDSNIVAVRGANENGKIDAVVFDEKLNRLREKIRVGLNFSMK